MNVSSKTFRPIKIRNKTCFLTGTMLPLTIWILNYGAGSSWRKGAGCAERMRRSSAPDSALRIATVSGRPIFRIHGIEVVRTTSCLSC